MPTLPRKSPVGKATKDKTKRKGNLAEFLAASPLPGSRLRLKRSKDRGRRIVLSA